jgi:hypothetical protein
MFDGSSWKARDEVKRAGIHPGDFYLHYKSRKNYPNTDVYEILCVCLREADLVPMVVYRSIRASGDSWCRPLEEFRSYVEVVEGDDKIQMPRFQYVGSARK